MSVFIDFIKKMGLAVVNDKIKEALLKKQAQERLTDFLLRRKEIDFYVAREEEIDFEGLATYIRSDLMDDLFTRLLGKRKERGAARQRIITKSISYAKAYTKLSVERTTKIVTTAMDILAYYYRSKVNRETLFVASEIEDIVTSEHQDTKKHVSNEAERIVQRLDTIENRIDNCDFLSIDKSIGQIKDGDIKQIESKLAMFMDAIGTQHELYPDYRFCVTQNYKFHSQPMTEEAAKKYPQNIKIQASSVRLGQQPINRLDDSILNQAYRHQQTLHIDVEKAEQYLGTYRDPSQNIAQEMSGKKLVVKPPEFPPAIPYYVTVEDDIVFPYLLLRAKEILDDGTVIMSNEEQVGFPYLVKISLDPYNHWFSFTISVTSVRSVDQLNFRKLLKRVKQGGTISVKHCEMNQPLVSGRMNNCDFELLDEEIDLLKSIVKIEEYFHVQIVIPEGISQADHEIIHHICSLIDGDFSGCWSSFECRFIVSDDLKEKFSKTDNNESRMAHLSAYTFSVFGHDIKVPVLLSFEPAVVDNFEKTQAKIALCDNGDEVKVVFVPLNENGVFTETIFEGKNEESHSSLYM